MIEFIQGNDEFEGDNRVIHTESFQTLIFPT